MKCFVCHFEDEDVTIHDACYVCTTWNTPLCTKCYDDVHKDFTEEDFAQMKGIK